MAASPQGSQGLRARRKVWSLPVVLVLPCGLSAARHRPPTIWAHAPAPLLTPRIAAMPDTLPTKPLARSHSFRGPRPMAWPMLLLAQSPTAGWPFRCLDRTGARMQGAVRQTGLFLVVAGGPQDMPSGRLGYGRRAKRLTRHKWDARRGGGQVRQLGISGGLPPLSHVARQVRHLRSRTRGASVSLLPCSGASGAG